MISYLSPPFTMLKLDKMSESKFWLVLEANMTWTNFSNPSSPEVEWLSSRMRIRRGKQDAISLRESSFVWRIAGVTQIVSSVIQVLKDSKDVWNSGSFRLDWHYANLNFQRWMVSRGEWKEVNGTAFFRREYFNILLYCFGLAKTSYREFLFRSILHSNISF